MNRLDAIEACNKAMVMEPAIVGIHSGGVSRGRAGGVCPVHSSAECVETFYAASALGRLSLAQLWSLWRSCRKAARR